MADYIDHTSSGYIQGPDMTILPFRILNVKVTPRSVVTRSPIETGKQIADSKYREPTQITVTCVSTLDSWSEGYIKLDEIYTAPLVDDSGNLNGCVIATKAHNFTNMALVSMPYVQDGGEHFDRLMFDLEFQEILYVKSEVGTVNVALKEDKGTTSKGEVGAS